MGKIVILAMCFQLKQLQKQRKKNSGLNGTRTSAGHQKQDSNSVKSKELFLGKFGWKGRWVGRGLHRVSKRQFIKVYQLSPSPLCSKKRLRARTCGYVRK